MQGSPILPLDTHGGIANMSVDLTDAAPVIASKRLAHFNVAIREIDVKDSRGRSQVLAQYSTPLIVDVLKYQGPSGAPVGTGAVSDQNFTQIRFVIDKSASQAIFSDDSTAPLNFILGDHSSSSAGAGQTTSTTAAGPGLVAITDSRPFSIRANASEAISADFNLFESLAPTGGNGKGTPDAVTPFDTHGGISVQAAFFVAPEFRAGQITGQVLNADGSPVTNAVVVAVAPDGTVGNTAITDSSGSFGMHSILAGVYYLNVYNSYTNAAGAQFGSTGATSTSGMISGPGILVTPGLPTDSGTITD